MKMEITEILFVMLVIILAYRWHKKNLNLPPGPWNLPIIGYLAFLDPKAPYLTLTKLSRKFGPVYGLYLGSIYTVVISDVKLLKKALNNDAASGRAPLFLTHGIMKGYGLICAQGDLWKDQRKFVHNTLRTLGAAKIGANRKRMENLIVDHVVELVQFIKNQGKTVTLNPLEPLRHTLGSIINTIVFGKCWSRDDETWKWLQYLQEEGTKHIGVAGPCNFLSFLRFLPKTKQTMHFLIDGKLKTHKIYQQIIKEQKKSFDKGDEIKNLIQAFLAEREKRKNTDDLEAFYNDQQFDHLLADIFGASLDTTLATLRWFLLYISVHRNVQTIIRQQLLEACPNKEPSLDDSTDLPYLEASIAEVQRIRSVVPVGIPHGTLSEMYIGKYEIPKGAMIVPLQWALHMDPKIWSNPDEFDPERFIDKDGKFFKPESFIPFQTGKRMCVGDELARMFLFLFGAIIIKNFRIDCENVEQVCMTGDCGITLTPAAHKLVFTALY